MPNGPIQVKLGVNMKIYNAKFSKGKKTRWNNWKPKLFSPCILYISKDCV